MFRSLRFSHPLWSYCTGSFNARSLIADSVVVIVLWVSFAALSNKASAQGFFFGQGYGAAPGWRGNAWGGNAWGGGFGVAPSRIDITIGVQPSFPYPIGVPPSHFLTPPFSRFGHDPFVGGYRDYRSEYQLRVLQAHRAQLEFAESLGRTSPLGVDPLHQDDVYRRFGSGDSIPNRVPTLPQTPLGFADGNAFGPLAGGQFAESIPDIDWPSVTAENLAAISDQVIQSARRLDQSLARRGEEGDVWRQYLSTDLMVVSAQQPIADSQWVKILQNFDGVVANGELRWVMRSDGFAETRQWVSALVNANRSIANEANDAKAESFQKPDAVGSESAGQSPPVAPSNQPPVAPSPGGNDKPAYEVLPPPTRARL